MQKPTTYVVGVESWYPKGDKTQAGKVKVAVRVRKGQPGAGQFHGATNFKTR